MCLVAITSESLLAQATSSSVLPPTCHRDVGGDACARLVDGFNYLGPQLGALLVAGNVTAGRVGTLGGLPHAEFGSRINVMPAMEVPVIRAAEVNTGAPQPHAFATESRTALFLGIDGGLGVYKGMRIGGARVGAVDALVTAVYVPNSLARAINDAGVAEGQDVDTPTADTTFHIDFPHRSFSLSWGGRLGVIEGLRWWPDVTVSYARRDLPEVHLFTATGLVRGGEGSTLDLNKLLIQSDVWRVVAGKRPVSRVAVAVGGGPDRYLYSTLASFIATDTSGTSVSGHVRYVSAVTRVNLFADLLLDVPLLGRIAAEAGRTSGGSVSVFNRFGASPGTSRTYFSLGFVGGW